METFSSCSSPPGDCNRDIELLCEAFGSAFSLEAIASAYSQARHNVDMAGAILYDLQGRTSTMAHQFKDVEAASISMSEGASQCLHPSDGNVVSHVPSKIVSLVPQGEHLKPILYSRSVTSKVNESYATSWSSMGKDDNSMNRDMEEFLFKILGDGFQLDRKMIHEVLGLCGYDLEKSMETLVDLSASSLGKSDDVLSRTTEREKYLKVGSCQDPESSELPDSSVRSVIHNGEELCNKKKDEYDLQREILGSLFTAPERAQEKPKRSIPRNRVVSRSSAFGRPVIEPLKETKIEETFVAIKPLGVPGEEEEDENSYHALRQAVSKYWALMKEYYKAAAEAYAEGDQERAFKLIKEGQFYRAKAVEADEKSTQKNLETRCREDQVLLNMSTYTPKEAVKNLRRNLLIFAGIPNTRYLKLTVGNDDAQSRKKGRKQLVLEELEKESIKWTEEDDGKTVVILLDDVNPKTLSFAKK